MWEIIDNDGTIHSGNEDEMKRVWDIMIGEVTEQEEGDDDEENVITQADKDEWDTDWNGDLKLVEVHEVSC